ncbi:MAG: LytTR family transcriptional regulator, partial [Bacteroidales bacterium]|nr:LytTR family transcriptional regulator [Bacteroidales bacterium]
ESMSEYIKIHLEGDAAPLMVLYSLKKLMNELPSSRFVRIHRSYIVSIPNIVRASGSTVELSDGTQLPVGDIYRKAFKEVYGSSSPAR